MKICPACSARLGDDVSVCSSCEYRFDASDGKVDSGVKKTMMGLPALTDYRSMGRGSASDDGSPSPGKSPVGSTLFGLPALNFADAFSEISEAGQDATSMISAKDLKQVLRKEMETSPGQVISAVDPSKAVSGAAGSGPNVDHSKMTSFGMRAPTASEMNQALYGDAADKPFGAEFDTGQEGGAKSQRLSGARSSEVSAALRGWGLDEASSEAENHQATQVVSSETLQRSGFGAIGRDAEAIGFDAESIGYDSDDYSDVKNTVMGMQVSSDGSLNPGSQGDRFTDATRSINPNDLFGSNRLDSGGLPQNILDQVRNETLARQTTSLNVPSISSTPVSGLVRARSESGQQLRAMMDTPVMFSEESIAEESSVIDSDAGRETPASGVFKKLKRRLAAEAAGSSGAVASADAELSGSGVYQSGASAAVSDVAVSAGAFDDLFEESPKPKAFVGATLSSMADELASIPSAADSFGRELSLPDPIEKDFAKVESAIVAEPERVMAAVKPAVKLERTFGTESESVSQAAVAQAAVAQAAVVQAAVVQAAVVQAAEVKAAEGALVDEVVSQEKPRVVVSIGAAKAVSAEQPASEKGSSKGMLIAVVVGLLILGLVAFMLLK